MVDLSKKPWRGKLENIYNRIKMKKRIYQNVLHVAEAVQCKQIPSGILNMKTNNGH